jgi:hypothetical protein
VKWKGRQGIVALGVLAIACCGCSSSPARPPSFDPMQPDPNQLSAVLGPVTGHGSTTLTVTATRSMSLTVGCIGKGMLEVTGLLSGSEKCLGARIGRGAFGGWYFTHLRVRPGERLKLRVRARAASIWDIRVDGSA